MSNYKEIHRRAKKETHLSVTKILEFKECSQLGGASGFFYEKDCVPYLITNRHVVINEEVGKYPDMLKITVHIDPLAKERKELHKVRDIEVPLYKEGMPLWYEHPTFCNKVDVVAIDLSDYLLEEDVIFFLVERTYFT